MPNIKTKILAASIEEDQQRVAEQWAKTFQYGGDHLAVKMMKMTMACIYAGEFKVQRVGDKDNLRPPTDILCIADYLSHASRIVIDYQGLSKKNQDEFLCLFPKNDGKNGVISRTSTHSVHREGDKVVEVKSFTNGLIGQLSEYLIEPCDFGINIAMGGADQKNYVNNTITDNGYSGHVYFYRYDEEKLLMIGLEQSKPVDTSEFFNSFWSAPKDEMQCNYDQFDQSHSLIGASDVYTAAGSLYFSDVIYQIKLLCEKNILPPDKYGGMHLKLDDDNWPKIQNFLNDINKAINQEDAVLIELLRRTPESACEDKPKIHSYLAFNFKSYMDRIYQLFIADAALDNDETIKNVHDALLGKLILLQRGKNENIQSFFTEAERLINLSASPPNYQQAIERLKNLVNLQLKIDEKLNEEHTEILLKIEVDTLRQEIYALKTKLDLLHAGLQKLKTQPLFILQLQREIENLQCSCTQVFGDLTISSIQPETDITQETVSELENVKTRIESFLSSQPLKLSATDNFNTTMDILSIFVLFDDLVDYSSIDVKAIAVQFNEYLKFIARLVYKPDEGQTTNIFSQGYQPKSTNFDAGYAFVAQYREPIVLEHLFNINLANLAAGKSIGIARFQVYEKLFAEFCRNDTNANWQNIQNLLTLGSSFIGFLQKIQKAEDQDIISQLKLSSTQQILQFIQLHQEIIQQYGSNILSLTAEDSHFYPMTPEQLNALSDPQLLTICFEELDNLSSDSLIYTIVEDDELWQRVEDGIKTYQEELDKRADDIGQKKENLKKIRAFTETINSFNQALTLQNKLIHFEELERQVSTYPVEEVALKKIEPIRAQVLEETRQALEESQKHSEELRTRLRTQQEQFQSQLETQKNDYEQQPLHIFETLIKKFDDCDEAEKSENFAALKTAFEKLNEKDQPNYSPTLEKKHWQNQIYSHCSNDEIWQNCVKDRLNLFIHSTDFNSIVQDLCALKAFCDKASSHEFGHAYKQDVQNFYRDVLNTRLSKATPEQKINTMRALAHQHFKHRDKGWRLLADALMVISSLTLVGLVIAAARVSLGTSVFFSQAPTAREKVFNDYLKENRYFTQQA